MSTQIIWFPTWSCNFYTAGQSHGKNCPYCPLGLSGDGRVLMENNPTSPNPTPTIEIRDRIIAFLIHNREVLGNHVALSGGEPLLYPHLVDVLQKTQYHWSITSNSQHRPSIQKLIDAGLLERCMGWTASYHPLAQKEDVYRENLALIAENSSAPLRATLVISRPTILFLDASIQFLKSLPLQGYQFHVDSHPVVEEDDEAGAVTREEAEQALQAAGEPNPAIYAGAVPQGVLCDRLGQSLALSPSGHLHECVTKMHLDFDRLCEVNGQTDLASMQHLIGPQFCDIPCFACCDHVKHLTPDRSMAAQEQKLWQVNVPGALEVPNTKPGVPAMGFHRAMEGR